MTDAEMYRELYVAESRENHEILVRNLLALESGSGEGDIDEIFRAAHSMKGMSASLGFEGMERLCHAMEDIFQLVRSGALPPAVEAPIDLLLRCTDQIEALLDDIEGGGDGSLPQTRDLLTALADFLQACRAEGHAPLPDNGEADGRAPKQAFSIDVRLDAGCLARNLRAMLVLENLQEIGCIRATTPPRQVLEDGEFDGGFTVILESDAGREAIETAANGSEVAEVSVLPLDGAEPAGGSLTAANSAPPPERTDRAREVKHIRVDIARLDTMMNLVEDLVINRGRLKQIASRYEIKELDEALNMMGRSVADLQALMMNIRLIPLTHIFNRFPRVVRDTARHEGKEIEFVVEGGDTELDRSVMDGLSDPLLHLIRNAVNHGIEPPEVRETKGKPRKGTIRLSARRDRDNVILEIEDDGAGISVERVREKAIEKGIIEASHALTREEAIELLFRPGFSTASAVTDISGRGVGLDVVRSAIESLKGTIRVESAEGMGTRFVLMLPPTMAIVDVMMVRIGERRCSLPIHNIVEVASLRPESLYRIGGREAIMVRGEVLPLHRLEDMFGSSDGRDVLIILQDQGRRFCIPVSAVDGQQEVVVKPLSSIFGTCRGISGVTIPGDGDVVPILDVHTLIEGDA
ncbi:MAG: chemotaxis protein CheA [Methanomicrobiales archaeon]|nr:chemotaxis protein CheA [Methanomicrobiales archaeon]MDI6877325.1 chemotaxis protein CheA [Methanomicrobiales archaeon]